MKYLIAILLPLLLASCGKASLPSPLPSNDDSENTTSTAALNDTSVSPEEISATAKSVEIGADGSIKTDNVEVDASGATKVEESGSAIMTNTDGSVNVQTSSGSDVETNTNGTIETDGAWVDGDNIKTENVQINDGAIRMNSTSSSQESQEWE